MFPNIQPICAVEIYRPTGYAVVCRFDIKHLLKSAITKRTKEYQRLLLARDRLSTQICDVLSSIDFYNLQKAINRNVNQSEAKVIETHTRKLEKLTRNAVLPFTANETVTNISSCCLTSEQHDMLKFGLTHSICPPSISKTDVFICFELINQEYMFKWNKNVVRNLSYIT